MTLQVKLKEFQQKQKAILATNFYNLETLQGIMFAASKCNAPVILQLTRSSIDYMGLKEATLLARQALETYQVEGWIHLDHGESYELVKKCLKQGFDSVMIDASNEPFEKNVEITSRVVEEAARYGANVEAELGYIAKLGQEQGKLCTTVEEAADFVRQTGVDALAVALGSAHGFYTSDPWLNIERLKEIHAAIDTILVLHGSSGIPNHMLQEAIYNGITKVNLATEIKNTFIKTLKNILNETDEIDLRKLFLKATEAVAGLLKEKYQIVSL